MLAMCLGRVWAGWPELMLSSVVFGLISCPSPLAQLHWRHSLLRWAPGLTFVAQTSLFPPENRDWFVSGGGWRVHLEARSQYQFVSEGGGSEEHPPVQMARDIILLIVPASEITDRHPPLYCRSFKRDISDILWTFHYPVLPLYIPTSLVVSRQYRRNQQLMQRSSCWFSNRKRKWLFCTRCCVFCHLIQIIKFQTRPCPV